MSLREKNLNVAYFLGELHPSTHLQITPNPCGWSACSAAAAAAARTAVKPEKRIS